MSTLRKPRKRPYSEEKACIICSYNSATSELTKPRDRQSIITLKKAAELRMFDPILNLDESEYEEKLYYHTDCRNMFTHKKSLQCSTARNEVPSPELRQSTRNVCTPTTSRVYEHICIFCKKKNKYPHGSQSTELLTQSRELRSDDKIRNAAMTKLDGDIIAITSRDLVAAEAHYHKSCYRNYTRVEKRSSIDEALTSDTRYQIAVQNSYVMLYDYIRQNLFPQPHVMKLTMLTDRLVDFMCTNGYTNDDLKQHTKQHIRRKLESEFGDTLHFTSDANGRLLVFPDNLSMNDTVVKNMYLKDELQSLKNETDINQAIKSSAHQIHEKIKEMPKMPWPPQPDELDANYISLPEHLILFLNVLFQGDESNPSSKFQRLVQSVGQDIVYAVSCGRIIPAKHILLPWGVKSLTGNVELIKVLNRLGHSISYSKLEEIDTALCLQKLKVEGDKGVILPTSSHPCIPTSLAYDNIDRLEETLSGGGTSHRVNGIIIQPQVATVQPQDNKCELSAKKLRSITPVSSALPDYNAGNRQGPPLVNPLQHDYELATKHSHNVNLLWILVRLTNTSEQCVSSWTGFNIVTHDNSPIKKDTIGYLPTINAPATQLSTVNEILSNVLKIKKALDIEEIVCVFDQALYAKASEITWKHTDMYKQVVLRMGTFHTLCNLISIIGKRFSAAGLRDIAIESGIIAEGSVSSVLEGRQYNRGVRLYKLMYEALLRLAWRGFSGWLEEYHPDDLKQVEEALNSVKILHADVCETTLNDTLMNTSVSTTINRFTEYLDHLRIHQGKLASFWMSFLDMVEILLGMIRASREGNWLLHLSTIQSMIPWCFAYDKQNYAKYLSVYYSQMTKLQETHPRIHQHMLWGGFSVQLSEHNPFGRIPVDQALEETVNRDTQTAGNYTCSLMMDIHCYIFNQISKLLICIQLLNNQIWFIAGGTRGFSLNPGAVSRYYITSEYRSACLKQLRRMTNIRSIGLHHHDLTTSRIKTDEKAIKSLVDLMETNWTNPFSVDSCEMINLSTGASAPHDIENDLLQAHAAGQKHYNEFKCVRLEKGDVEFFSRLPKLKLKTFENMRKKITKTSSNKEIVLRSDNKLFGHMLLVARSRQLDMKDVLQHPLGPLPWSLANCDGTIKKTNKAALARKLESNAHPAEDFPRPSACIIDGMSIVQKIRGDNLTFNELSDQLLACVLRLASGSDRIDVVFDTYQAVSIKEAERALRRSENGIRFTNIEPGHKIQQWRRLLSCGTSKTKLIQFISEQWQREEKRKQLGKKMMYVTSGEHCTLITSDMISDVEELRSVQEEADTRILLHVKHAGAQVPSTIIISEDSDVMILCLAFQKDIKCKMFVKCGTASRIRYIDVSKVAKTIGHSTCTALPGMHAYTGCDTVSSFSGRGKLSALKILQSDKKFQKGFTQLGKDWVLNDELFQCLEEFTCRIYSPQTNINDVNEMRYELFRLKNGNIESSQLPPCRDSLHMHAIRANYQAAIWQRSLQPNPDVPSPDVCKGWTLDDDGQLMINWMTGAAAPNAVLEFLFCKCKQRCVMPKCQCLVNGLKCTESCRLQSCTNMNTDDDENNGHDNSEDEYESDN